MEGRDISLLLLPFLLAQGDTLPGDTTAVPVRPILLPATSVAAATTAEGVEVTWTLSPDDSPDRSYEVWRAESPEAAPSLAGSVGPGEGRFLDTDARQGASVYFVRLKAGDNYVDSDWSAIVEVAAPVVEEPAPGWFNFDKTNVLLFLFVFAAVFFGYLVFLKRGGTVFIRKIAGLESLDDAVGRSTEMGKPIVFVPGIGALDLLGTIAGLTILKHVAKKAAQYETDVIVPNSDPVVMAAAQEIVKEACAEVGRPDLYNEDNVFFMTTAQFGYAAGVNGLMVRERPGAVFLQGVFYAESLILAETAYSVGAIQIAGTSSVTQLPFFIAACDYTLIGEELFAASAYLSRNAVELVTLKAEDVFKALFILFIVAGSVLASFNINWLITILGTNG